MKRLIKEISAKDKIKFIQNLLSGMIDITTYRPPQNYHVFSDKEDEYRVSTHDGTGVNFTLNQTQYDNWKETLSEQDTLVVFFFRPDPRNEPLVEVAPNLTVPESVAKGLEETPKEAPTVAPEPQPRKRAKKGLKKEPEIIEAMKIQDEVFVMKTSGLLSEYGKTWRISSRQNN